MERKNFARKNGRNFKVFVLARKGVSARDAFVMFIYDDVT